MHFLDGGAVDRSIALPLLSSGDDWRIIANVGTANLLNVTTSSGSVVASLGVRESALFFGSSSEWIAIRGSAINGDVFGPAGVGHVKGLVPDPGPTAGLSRFLMDDGTWSTVGSFGPVDAFKKIFDGTNTATASGLDQLRIRSSDSSIILVATNNDGTFGDVINFTVDPSHVNHNLLSNYIANQHVDHTSVSISTTEGIQGGGDISSTRTLKLNFSALGTATPALSDTIAYFQTATHFKTTWTAINAILDHNGLLNYTANRHIDHSVVSMIAGTGLSGGGDLTTSRTFNIALGGLTTTSSMLSGDLLLLSRSATPEAITFANFNAALDASIMVNYHDVTKSNLAGGNVFTGNETISPISPASPAIAIFTPTSTLGQGFSINQTGAGVAPLVAPFILGNFAYNGIMINDAVDASSTFGVVSGIVVQTNIAGASAQGFHGAGGFTANVNGAVPTNGTFAGAQGVSALAQSLYPMGGTGTTALLAKGTLYGFGSIVIAYGPGGSGAGAWPGATNLFNVTTGELNWKIATGASVYALTGLQLCALSDHAVPGAVFDIGYSLSAQAGAVGLKNGFAVSDLNGQHPMAANSTIFGTIGAGTAGYGVDVSSYTLTLGQFKGKNFLVNDTEVKLGVAGTARGQLNFAGVTSGNTTLHAPAVASGDQQLPVGSTTLAGLSVQQTWTGQQLYLKDNFALLPGTGVGVLTINVGNGATVGTITLPQGTTDFSATGGAGQVVKQTTAGGPFTVGVVSLTTDVTGTLLAAQEPAHTGDVTNSAGSLALTLATAQPAVHTWALTQTFTFAPVFIDQSGSRTALGLGTAATQNTGTSGATIPLLNGTNTWSATQAFTNTTNSGTLAITGTSQFTGNITLLNATSGNNQGSLAFSYNSVNDSNLRTYANSDISIVDSYVTTNYPSTNAFGRVFDIMAAGGNVGAHLRLMTQNINSAAVQAAHVWPTGGVYIGTSNSVDPGAQNLATGGYLQTAGYTVAGLPAASAANKGAIAYVTDALAPTFLATVVGGGAIITPVFSNGTNWVGG